LGLITAIWLETITAEGVVLKREIRLEKSTEGRLVFNREIMIYTGTEWREVSKRGQSGRQAQSGIKFL